MSKTQQRIVTQARLNLKNYFSKWGDKELPETLPSFHPTRWPLVAVTRDNKYFLRLRPSGKKSVDFIKSLTTGPRLDSHGVFAHIRMYSQIGEAIANLKPKSEPSYGKKFF